MPVARVMARRMNIDPVAQNQADNVVSVLIAVWAGLVAWLEPTKFLIILTIILTAVKLAHSIVLLRRDLKRGD